MMNMDSGTAMSMFSILPTIMIIINGVFALLGLYKLYLLNLLSLELQHRIYTLIKTSDYEGKATFTEWVRYLNKDTAASTRQSAAFSANEIFKKCCA